MPEPGGHGLVVSRRNEAGGQLVVYGSAQPDWLEYGPIRLGNQPVEAGPGELLVGGLDEAGSPQVPGHWHGAIGAESGPLGGGGAEWLRAGCRRRPARLPAPT